MLTFPPQTGRPVVFYVPHADDETLFMIWMIIHHVLAGREVHVVLCCNGNLTSVFEQLNGLTKNTGWWGDFHYPEHEGYEPLTRIDMSRTRGREFVNACLQAGVKRENIHYGRADVLLTDPALLPDNISVDFGQQVITSWAEYFADQGWPFVGHYTMHWLDPHGDHSALGEALHNVSRGAKAGDTFWDVRWAVKPEQATVLGAEVYPVPAVLRPEVLFRQNKAAKGYGAWCPPYGFAVGFHSVYTQYFVAALRGDPNYIVRTG